MSKREEISNTRISPRALQRKLSAISRQRSVNEGSKETRRPRDSSTEDLGLTRGSRAEKSVSIDERQVYEKYTEIVSQLGCFYELFRSYAMNKDIKEKLIGVISEDKEEDPLQMLKYMNYTVGLLLDSDQPEKPKSGEFQSGPDNDYEELLQKAENDIRQHIRIEQQMKLLIDGLQAKVDEYEKDNPSDEDSSEKAERVLKERIENSQLMDTIKEKEGEIASMQKTLKQKEELIKSLEEKTLSIAILEHTLKSQKESHKKDKENIRNYYEQELANVTKEIQHIQRVLAINLSSDDKVQLLQEELLSSKDFNIKKVQLLENRIRQLGDTPLVTEREETEPTVMYTDPGFDIDRRYSVRPSATASSIMRSRGYDLKSHRCSTDMFQKNSENRPTKNSPQKKKKDVINELRATTALGTRYLNKNSFREQPQQGPAKMQKDCENYFNYLKRKIDNLPQAGDRDREHLRSFDARRSNSVKKGVYLAGAAGMVKDKSVDRLTKGDMSRTHDERSESLADKHTKSVPKLLRNTATSTAYAKLLKH